MKTLADLPSRALPDEAPITAGLPAAGLRHDSVLSRLLFDSKFRGRVVRFTLRIPTPLRTRDRWVLEELILPYYAARSQPQKVLFIGCDYYTWHYERWFRAHDYSTIDPAGSQARFGAARHVRDGMENLGRHFAPESLDVIFCNGVVGFGLDRREDAEVAFGACATALKPGGHLVVGYTDVPGRVPYDPLGLDALRQLDPLVFPALGTSVYLTPTPYRQTFAFYSKRR